MKKPVRLYPKKDTITEKIKPYLTKELGGFIIFIILLILLIILAIASKSPYNMNWI